MAAEAEDAFQRELVELFVQEAQEWLQQIHDALDELQQGPTPERHIKLAHTIKAGLTNLGGSAATIALHDVERASFGALPFVDAVQDPTATICVNDFIALCRQLGHIHTALTNATGVTFDAKGPGGCVEAGPVTVGAREFLSALQKLYEQQAGVSSRNMIQTVTAQVQGMVQNGVATCDVTALREFLTRVGEAEEAFYAAARQQVPGVFELLALGQATGSSSPSHDGLQAALHQVEQLWREAQQVSASEAMTFFMGLHSFLALAIQRRIQIASSKYAAVASRLEAMLETIHVWVDAGHAERSVIAGLLPDHS